MDKKVKYWIELAEYDLETAQVMLDSGRLLYVGFMCHQVIEKVLKGLYTQVIKDAPPYTHDIRLLARKTGVYDDMTDDVKDFLDYLMPLNIQARYPAHKDATLKRLTKTNCAELLKNTKELYKWITNRLSNT